MKSIKAIFFDFDGVILESVEVKGWAFGKLFEKYPEQVNKIIAFHHANGGMSRFDKFRYYYKVFIKKPLSESDMEKLCAQFSDLVVKKVINSPWVPGAKDFLEKYKELKLFVVSATPQEEIEHIILKRDMAQYFDGIFGSPTKKSQWLEYIINDLNIKPKELLFIGDAMNDYNAARLVDCLFIARQIEDHNCFDGFPGITAILKNLNRLDQWL